MDADLSILNLGAVKRRKAIPGLMDTMMPCCQGPRRVGCKVFQPLRRCDVCQYVLKKPLNKDVEKPGTKAPKNALVQSVSCDSTCLAMQTLLYYSQLTVY